MEKLEFFQDLIKKIRYRGLIPIIVRKFYSSLVAFNNILLKFSIQLNCDKKIKNISRTLTSKDENNLSAIIEKHKKVWKPLKKNVNTKWIETYINISGIPSEKYIPEDIYYLTVEPILNDYEKVKSFEDKNYYHQIFKDYSSYFPKTVLMNIKGRYYNSDYLPIFIDDSNFFDNLYPYEKLIIKPSIDSHGGENVELINRHQDGFFNKVDSRI